MARRTVRLGIARHRMGRTKDAIPILEKAVAMHEESFGKDHAETGRQLTELGAAYRAEGRHEEAQKCLRRAMRIHQQAQGIDSPGSIESLHHLAGSLEDAGDPEGAAQQYETALTYKLRTIGSNLDDLAEMQFGLANLHINWQHYSRASRAAVRSLGHLPPQGRRAPGRHLRNAGACGRMLRPLYGRGKGTRPGREGVEGMRPERTPELIRNMERRAELLDQLRKKGEASYLREKIALLQQQLEQEEVQRQAALPPKLKVESLPGVLAKSAKPESANLESAKVQSDLSRISLQVGMRDTPFPKTT